MYFAIKALCKKVLCTKNNMQWKKSALWARALGWVEFSGRAVGYYEGGLSLDMYRINPSWKDKNLLRNKYMRKTTTKHFSECVTYNEKAEELLGVLWKYSHLLQPLNHSYSTTLTKKRREEHCRGALGSLKDDGRNWSYQYTPNVATRWQWGPKIHHKGDQPSQECPYRQVMDAVRMMRR